MSFSNAFSCIQRILSSPDQVIKEFVRYASKKARASTQNVHNKVRPKHRGWKKLDGSAVEQGTILATQRMLRWHPGLNVGIGRNKTLYAMIPGKVAVTCEKVNLDWNNIWIQNFYGGRERQTIYKKHFNILPEPQHTRFKLIDQV